VIRVVVCDDHAVVRAGLGQLIGTFDGVTVTGTAGSAEEALALVAGPGADVVLMDLEMPGTDGIAATRALRAAHPGAAVVILTSFNDRARILAATDAGAIGYLLKDATPDDLERGIRAAARGESPLDPRAAGALLGRDRAHDPGGGPGGLSPREREVLALVAEGLPNKRIARRLGISEKTVKAHLTSVFRTIGVDDRTQAAMWAMRNGVAEPPGPGPRPPGS
jgi:DNA-binding NarL/FixJ family response regulator